MSVKQVVNLVVNGVVLKPLGLRLGYRIGGDPVEDISRLLKAHPIATIVDGGAYQGTFTKAMAAAFPGAQIHAFEPTPASHELLARNVQALPHVQLHRVALGDQKGTAKFFTNASPLTNSLRRSSELGRGQFGDLVVGEKELQVDVSTLADFAHENNISNYDLVKLDLQGNELEALLGMRELISGMRAALIEVQFAPLYEGAPVFSDIELLLREKGLVLYQLYELVRSPIDGRLLYGDALFISSELLRNEPSRSTQ